MSQGPGSLLKAVLYPLIQRFSIFFPFSKKGPLEPFTEGNMGLSTDRIVPTAQGALT